MTPHSSTLAWKTPWMEEPAVHGVAKSRTWLSGFTFTFHFHALEKEMATHSSVLAWRIPRTGKPGGLPSNRLHRVGHDWSDLAAAAERLNWTKVNWKLIHVVWQKLAQHGKAIILQLKNIHILQNLNWVFARANLIGPRVWNNSVLIQSAEQKGNVQCSH